MDLMHCSLNKICSIQYGYPFDSAFFCEKGMPLIRIRDVVRGYTKTYTTEECASEYIVKYGDILIGMDGEFNVAKWKSKEAFLNQRVCRLNPDLSRVNAEYLFYYMHTALKTIEGKTPYVTVKHLSAKELNKIEVPLPSLEDQNHIASLLGHVDRLMTFRQNQLVKLDELVKSRFVEIFGDPVTNSKGYPIHQLSDHILFLTSGSRGWAQYYTDKGEWFITIKNVKDCRISVDDVQCINPPKNAEAERTRLREGDLLISITADLGRTGVVTKEIAEHGAYNNQHLTCIRLDRLALDPLYAAFFMESEAGKRQFEAKNMSAVKAGLNFDSIRSLRLIVPPLALQKEFTAFVAEVDKSKLAVKQSLEKLETLKKSLMQQYFG